MNFDNHDERIKYYELLLEQDLDALPHFQLPQGYRFSTSQIPRSKLTVQQNCYAANYGGIDVA